jgi:prepilin-type processing-associated H-X9-DG protein
MNTKSRFPRWAFTLVEAMVVIGILCLLIALVIPMRARMERRSSRIGCINNQKQIILSFKQWALDNDDKFPMAVSVTNGGAMECAATGSVWETFLVMSNELNVPKVLICPEDPATSRLTASAWGPTSPPAIPFTNNDNVSYFIGVDALDTRPTMVLCGDGNLTLRGQPVKSGLLNLLTNSPVGWTKRLPNHGAGGNVGLADGSVSSYPEKAFRQLLQKTGATTNRLAVP